MGKNNCIIEAYNVCDGYHTKLKRAYESGEMTYEEIEKEIEILIQMFSAMVNKNIQLVEAEYANYNKSK